MAIKKIKWKALMTNLDLNTELAKFTDDIEAIDEALNEALETYSDTPLKSILLTLNSDVLTSNTNGIWSNLDIYISSFKEHDKRFVQLLCAKIREYIAFYTKILNDSGVQRALQYAKTYENDGSASGIERGTNSVTPQNSSLYDSTHPESDALFDQAIADYASAIDKNKSSSTSHSQGGSTTNVTGVTWEEGKKNLQLMFYNELKEYLVSIPERVYSYYSIDTIPVPELTKLFFNYLDQVRQMFESDE